MNLSKFVKSMITLLIISFICHIIDAFSILFDYRFSLGIAMGVLLWKPVYSTLGKFKIFKV